MITIGLTDEIIRISVSKVTPTVPETAGLDPDAGHVTDIVFEPVEAKYMLKEMLPVVVVPVVVPYTVVPPVSIKVAAQLPVNRFKSSPLIIEEIVKEKFTVGVLILEVVVI